MNTYKGVSVISQNDIESLKITSQEKIQWVDDVLRNKANYVLPTKIRMPLKKTDYFNIMPCALPSENILGLKVVTRNENRRLRGQNNIDGDILMYSFDDFLPLALIDGGYVTTMRTAAIAVHSILNLAPTREKIAMLGLGKIGTEIGSILFDLTKNETFTVKLYRYKDQAERFVQRFSHYPNITFQICETYQELMSDSDVVVSAVTYAEEDFCPSTVYKNNCTIVPVHLRGFKECDKTFDMVISSDMESIKKFENYDMMKAVSYLDDIYDDICKGKALPSCNQRIIYNLGLAVYDLFFANKIYSKMNANY